MEYCSCPTTLFDGLLPVGVKIVECSGSGVNVNSHYLAGRLCAQDAIAQFEEPKALMLRREDGRPMWPATLTGSITHTKAYVAAAVGEQSQFSAIGIDAEIIDHVTRDLWENIFLPVEIEWIKSLPVRDQSRAATLIFSGKESFYKCQYEITGQWLEFKNVRIDVGGWNSGGNRFEISPVSSVKIFKCQTKSLVGHFAFAGELVLTTMFIVMTDQ